MGSRDGVGGCVQSAIIASLLYQSWVSDGFLSSLCGVVARLRESLMPGNSVCGSL